jgi:SOS-response transcriptional repressor LexA
MAAPHVAGAWALLKQKRPCASVDGLLSALQSTGTQVKDTRVTDGLTKPRINIDFASGQANDCFANAQAITGASYIKSYGGDNLHATKESGEPNHAGNIGGKSIWYKWTPEISGTTTIDTSGGNNIDTLLAVYTGGAVNSLTEVASNDDENHAGGVITSKLSFAATAGTTYRIAVDGYNLDGTGAKGGSTRVTLRQDLSVFGPDEDWTGGPYYGRRGTFFADVTGDGADDAIAVMDDTVLVRRSTGSGFQSNEDWTHGPYYGSRGTYFADVTGDGRADAIVVNDNTVVVRPSTGSEFGPNQDWTHGRDYGTRVCSYFVVSGDGKADAIVVNDDTVLVRPSTGSEFGPNQDWTHGRYYGTRRCNFCLDDGTFFADVTGDGKADAIAVDPVGVSRNETVAVRRSTGSEFAPTNEDWTHGPYYGSRGGPYFVDVTGDGKADAIAINDDTVLVRRSTGSEFAPTNEDWTHGPYYGSRGTYFADVTGDGRADAIVVNDNTVVVRRSM